MDNSGDFQDHYHPDKHTIKTPSYEAQGKAGLATRYSKSRSIREEHQIVEQIAEDSHEESDYENRAALKKGQGKEKEEKEFKLFVGGITGDTINDDLFNYFSQFVEVKDAFVVIDSTKSSLS